MPDVPQIPADQLIEVPPQFLPAFLEEVSNWIVTLAQEIEGSGFAGTVEQPWREREDDLAESMLLALRDRAAIMRALDHGTPIEAGVIRFRITEAIDGLHLQQSEALALDDDLAVEQREEELRSEMRAWWSALDSSCAELSA